jgi:hypothetical protein
MPKDQREFQLFQRLIASSPAILLLETAFLDPRRRAKLAHRISISTTYTDRTDDGLPTSKAYTELAAIDDALDVAARELGDSIPATLTSRGVRTWLWYTAAAKPALAAIRAVADASGSKLKITDAPDREWSAFEDVLPTDEEVRWNGDALVLEQLAAAGDDPTQEHELEHLAVFPSRHARDQFITWLHEEDFDLASHQPSNQRNSWPVEFTKLCRIDIDAIFEQTWACTLAALEFGGEYDGWQTHVIPKASTKKSKPNAR